MSFHPRMPYGEGWHKSDRQLPEEGPPFAYSDENRRRFEDIAAHYPLEQRKSAIWPRSHRPGAAGLRLAQRDQAVAR
jgi:hypothetical protein